MMYTISRQSGEILMQSETDCRYPTEIELAILQAGYIIRLNRKKITKKEVLQNA